MRLRDGRRRWWMTNWHTRGQPLSASAAQRAQESCPGLTYRLLKHMYSIACKEQTLHRRKPSMAPQPPAPTLSLAVPASLVAGLTHEAGTIVAGSIARCAAACRMQEVVIYDDPSSVPGGRISRGAGFLARLLQYLEAPPWMRKSLFPVHEDLRMVGLVPALGCPHHATDASGAYPREGVVVGHAKDGAGVLVRLGEGEEVTATGTAQEGTRVTVRAGDGGAGERGKAGKKRRREQAGLTVEPRGLGFDLGDSYRGYVVRVTRGLSGVLAEGPFENGYDWTVGTVESSGDGLASLSVPAGTRHALIAVGGRGGLAGCLERDGRLEAEEPGHLLDALAGVCAKLGTSSLQAEEVAWAVASRVAAVLGR